MCCPVEQLTEKTDRKNDSLFGLLSSKFMRTQTQHRSLGIGKPVLLTFLISLNNPPPLLYYPRTAFLFSLSYDVLLTLQ